MGELPPAAASISAVEGMEAVESYHTNMVQRVLPSNYAPKEALLHSYKKSFNGFVARLTEEEAERISEMEDVVSVFENTIHHPQTTRSWDFLGFPEHVSRSSEEGNTIVGVFDSGIWPESDSFKDQGFDPPPPEWKGSCQNITCNNKIIGAKYFRVSGLFLEDDIISPRDTNGHGSHCASTAAGNVVGSASLLGLASGTARGGVPLARIAAYKVCWYAGCEDADILAAFDEAIADGVHVITLSIAPAQVIPTRPYYEDVYAIGSFHAMKNGILTSKAAGNRGPEFYTMPNMAPWFVSVAASTTDRRFLTTVQLGNGRNYEGVSINTFIPDRLYPLIYGEDAVAAGARNSSARRCSGNSLNPALVRGKIVLCDSASPTQSRLLTNGVAGIIIRNDGTNDAGRIYALPATSLSQVNGSHVLNYIRSTRNPTGLILRSTEVTLAPTVIPSSSRGPNRITPDLLQPDIAAPGLEILSAYSPTRSISGIAADNRKEKYSILSGTSIAAPHVAAIAAYIKSFHPTWSPAAIKSAILTTATPIRDSRLNNAEAEFAYGAGQLNPTGALNPGLVYNLSVSDYVRFLCGQGYDNTKLRLITRDNSDCDQIQHEFAWNLNLPSFVLPRNNNQNFHRVYQRSVTNVGRATSTYRPITTGTSSGFRVQVTPTVLSFSSIGETRSFTVTVSGTTSRRVTSASLVWDDGTHQVRSPIVEPNTEGAEGEESSGPATEGDGPEGEHGTRATRVRQPPVWLKDFVSMAETHSVELVAVVVELQKTQALLEKRCTATDDRLLNVEELLGRYIQQMTGKSADTASGPNQRPMVSNLKFEIPPFDGTDAEYWVFKIKEFFRIAGTPEDQRIGLAALYMTGPASAWYMWMSQNGQISTWDAFLDALIFRFGSTLYEDARGALKQVVQVNTVGEYQAEFEAISTKVSGLSEEWLISFFVFGLKTHLKCEVLLAQPSTYYQAVSLAKLHEQKHNEVQLVYGTSTGKSNDSPPGRSFSKFLPNQGSAAGRSLIPVPGSKSVMTPTIGSGGRSVSSQGSNNVSHNNTNNTIPAYKRFTAAELKDRRARGLCYYCPKKWVRGHKCTPTYCILIAKEEFDQMIDDEAEDSPTESVVMDVPAEATGAVPEISFNALEGQFHPSTIRVTGRHEEHTVQVLIDNGSTLNFIKRSVAEKLKLQLNEIKPFRVQTGNGAFLVCNHQCKQVKFIVQHHVFIVDLFVMDIKGADVVLGVQWLAELGNIVINHKDLTMKFQLQGQEVNLQGESILKETPVNGKAIKKMAEEDTIACLFSLQKVTEEEGQEKLKLQEEIDMVLEQYQDVFSEPKQLPPVREVDHHINLMPGSKPVSVCPYRYPYFQKAEIERLVEEMLQTGFVVETDASSSGIGAVLSQQGHPIAYFSKKLTTRMSHASTYVRELFAITQAVMKWRHYLLGRKFFIKTDHKSLKELMHQVIQTPDQQFYLSKLLGFEYEIVYRTGKTNMAADALSRKDEFAVTSENEPQIMLLSEYKHEIIAEIRKANREEDELLQLHSDYKQQQLTPEYSVREGILFFEGRMMVPGYRGGDSKVESVDDLLKRRDALQQTL
ncbi:cucumisin-like [Senna tora]|uniref:Cucumisin-like n=1 Tax=Senna tora TaxID=362788 RepID=A0A834WQH8_9FABA|nr:cucumisin-like [Senna tora]